MTERIKELALQAGDDWEHTLESDKQFLQKFAELIVRKCISMADEFEMDVNRSGLVDKMKEYFGVEE